MIISSSYSYTGDILPVALRTKDVVRDLAHQGPHPGVETFRDPSSFVVVVVRVLRSGNKKKKYDVRCTLVIMLPPRVSNFLRQKRVSVICFGMHGMQCDSLNVERVAYQFDHVHDVLIQEGSQVCQEFQDEGQDRNPLEESTAVGVSKRLQQPPGGGGDPFLGTLEAVQL